MTRVILFVSIATGIGALARGYYEAGQSEVVSGLLIFAVLWLVAQFRNWRWFASLGFSVAALLAAYGVWTHVSAGWMLAGIVGALFAWDLSDFEQRLENAPTLAERAALEAPHLIRMSLAAGLGFFASLASMLFRPQFSFEWVAFLALLAAIGLTQLVGRMRKGG